MEDALLIGMYILTGVLAIGAPILFTHLWRKEQKEISEVLAYNKWYKEERLRQIKQHKLELLELQRKRFELELKWQLEYADQLKQVEQEVDAKYSGTKGVFTHGSE